MKIIKLKNHFILIGEKELEYYKGVLIQADTGLHNQAINLLKKHFPPPSNIIELGCGEGAFSMRLIDEGYNVEAIDINVKAFKLSDKIKHFNIDLNNSLQITEFLKFNSYKYEGVVALEVIEHLQNPYQFVEFSSMLIKDKGYILLSTPNITSFLSRIIFFKKGEFHQFQEEDKKYGHINPITSKELESIFDTYSLQVIEKQAGGLLPLFWITKNIKFTLKWILRSLYYYPFMKGDKDGWCLVYLLRKE